MAFELVIEPSALDDLYETCIYIAEQSGLATADGGLVDFPGRGTPRDELMPGLWSIAYKRSATIKSGVTGGFG